MENKQVRQATFLWEGEEYRIPQSSTFFAIANTGKWDAVLTVTKMDEHTFAINVEGQIYVMKLHPGEKIGAKLFDAQTGQLLHTGGCRWDVLQAESMSRFQKDLR